MKAFIARGGRFHHTDGKWLEDMADDMEKGEFALCARKEKLLKNLQ